MDSVGDFLFRGRGLGKYFPRAPSEGGAEE